MFIAVTTTEDNQEYETIINTDHILALAFDPDVGQVCLGLGDGERWHVKENMDFFKERLICSSYSHSKQTEQNDLPI